MGFGFDECWTERIRDKREDLLTGTCDVNISTLRLEDCFLSFLVLEKLRFVKNIIALLEYMEWQYVQYVQCVTHLTAKVGFAL